MVTVDRMRYIVYYYGKDVVKRLNIMPVNIAFISKRNNYVVFYGDQESEKYYFNQMKNVKGFKKLETSPIYNVDANYRFER